MTTPRSTMNGKPVLQLPAKSIINFKSGFVHKLLCDGPTFSTGTACAYTCSFCYVPDAMRKLLHQFKERGELPKETRHEDVVIRRENALEVLRSQLMTANGKRRFDDPNDRRVIYASPLVDVAANMELCRETADICAMILELTNWQIRLLSKSHLLPMVATMIVERTSADARDRVIYGVSTGTFDDRLAKAFEAGTPLVSKRIESLHWLQDQGYRTFGMVCPSLPQRDYAAFAEEAARQLRPELLEHVWAEVINVRGDSMVNTVNALRAGGFEWEATELQRVSTDKAAWESYARATFEAHAKFIPAEKLRFLQYVTKDTRSYWAEQKGAILL